MLRRCLVLVSASHPPTSTTLLGPEKNWIAVNIDKYFSVYVIGPRHFAVTMSFTSNELNYLVWRYLHESGFEHTAFVFGHESELNGSAIVSSEVPSGSLVSIVQRGLYYIDAEVKAYNNELPREGEDDAECKMSLIDGGDCMYEISQQRPQYQLCPFCGSQIEEAAYLNHIVRDPSESPVVQPPSPSDAGHSDVAASMSPVAANTDNSLVPQSGENVTGVDGLAPSYGSEMTAEVFRDYIISRMARSGPLEALPSFNPPVFSVPQYNSEQRKNGERPYQYVDNTAVLQYPQQGQQPRNW
ncbi:hypothetical protein RB195_005111 [Necator americanus]|uniref:Uncharacterized protein n=1 Tax=Necator americanus TaxID=51031 RepID=A0ABR1BN27_NECAM